MAAAGGSDAGLGLWWAGVVRSFGLFFGSSARRYGRPGVWSARSAFRNQDLPKTLLLPDAKLVREHYGADAVVQVVALAAHTLTCRFVAQFCRTLPRAARLHRCERDDAGIRADEALANPDFLRMTPEAFSFVLAPNAHVLNFYGGSAELLRAEVFGAREARVIDDSRTRVKVLRSFLGASEQSLLHGDPRQLLARGQSTPPEVIAVSLLGTHGTATAGAASLDPSFLLTAEAFAQMFDALSPAGHIAISTWVENPARSGVRLAALCVETLRARGVAEPARHLLAMRSWSSVSIFVGRHPFDAIAIEALKRFCDENSFDLVWFAGIDPAETNQINVLPEDDPYHAAFAALFGLEREQFIAQAPFALSPPTDDRPFFNQSFRWAAVPQWMETMGMEWLPFVEWGYILHVATLLVVTVLGLLLLIAPAFASRARPRISAAVLFLLLGIAYMLVQMWAIMKLSFLLGHPLSASAIVLSAMLVASGIGAAVLPRGRLIFAVLVVALIVAIGIFPLLMRFIFPQAEWLRIATGICWLALPAFFMGVPFPNALARLANESALPWALALNGFGSVIGALLATLIAVHFGLLVLAGSAVVLYAIVALLSVRPATFA
jgi:hypothetical protein